MVQESQSVGARILCSFLALSAFGVQTVQILPPFVDFFQSMVTLTTCNIVGLTAAGQSAYVRYVVPTPDDQEATVEYDLDEEDEEWLQKHNLHVS